ncbi:MAG: hypothetical protein HC886_14585 [Leptolyngbyaceae cyanobacterium SM1_1_3]|nr:hypothetical protein [Leptolyngbyaceae cyanobacterium SM1_1_3]NJN03245.1 hypothetical protein [Leptolyngbyaceae cyanobacterium RM1_1_2]
MEEDSETAALYENIFDVRLNFKISIMFIPSLYQTVRSSWVPTLPDNVDCISTELEARLITAALSNYIVTPDKELAGTELIIKNDLLQGVKTSIFFYVTPEEFETFTIELSDLAERLFSIHDSRQVSEVNNLDFVKLILSKIITSTHFIKEDLHVLGRAKSINDHFDSAAHEVSDNFQETIQ